MYPSRVYPSGEEEPDLPRKHPAGATRAGASARRTTDRISDIDAESYSIMQGVERNLLQNLPLGSADQRFDYDSGSP